MDGGGGGIDFEVEEPLAWDVAAVDFGRSKFPELGGLKCAVGEILAWPGSGEGCLGYIAGFVHVYFHTEPDFASDGVSGLLRRVGQDLPNYFAARHTVACSGRG